MPLSTRITRLQRGKSVLSYGLYGQRTSGLQEVTVGTRSVTDEHQWQIPDIVAAYP